MRVSVTEDGRTVAYLLKGAAEVLLARSDLDEEHRDGTGSARIEAAAADGYRSPRVRMVPDNREDDLIWLGAAWLWDPPRPEVPAAIAAAHDAGIRVLMITGDHPATAASIAEPNSASPPTEPSPVTTSTRLDPTADSARLSARSTCSPG